LYDKTQSWETGILFFWDELKSFKWNDVLFISQHWALITGSEDFLSGQQSLRWDNEILTLPLLLAYGVGIYYRYKNKKEW